MTEQVALGMRAGLTLLIGPSLTGVVTLSAATSSSAQPVPAPPVPAQTVPIPKPAPKGRGGLQLSASDPQRGPMQTGATPAALPPNPVIPDPRRNLPANIFATFDANQKAQAARVSSYLSSLQTLVGNFVQVGPDGSKTKGDFYTQKPGNVRFEYDAPSPIAIIADGSSLAVRDTKLATQDIYPLSQTPLRFLLSDRIDLLKDTNVVNVTADDVFISVTIEEKQALIGPLLELAVLGADHQHQAAGADQRLLLLDGDADEDIIGRHVHDIGVFEEIDAVRQQKPQWRLRQRIDVLGRKLAVAHRQRRSIGDNRDRTWIIIFETHLAGLLDVEIALGLAAVGSDLDEISDQRLQRRQIGTHP